jgi:hypothetical protein
MQSDKVEEILSGEAFRQFVSDSLSGDGIINKKAFIGTITEEAIKRIQVVCGKNVCKITVDTGAIRHSYKRIEHNLEPDDIFHIIDVINTATDIKLQAKKHQNNETLLFQKDINGEITFLTEVRITNKELALVTCYRKKKVRQRSDGPK